MAEEFPVIIKENGLLISFYIQPKSSRNQPSGMYNGAFKLKIKAPPVEGAANKECIKYLSKTLKIPKSSISIVSGETGRQKKIFIESPKDHTLKNFRKIIITIFK